MPILQTTRPSPLVVVGIIVVLAVLTVVGVKSFSREQIEVRAAGVNHQNLISSISTNGKVEPVDEYQAHALSAGVVEKIYVDVGQKVKAGQLLVKMSDSDAQARLASATSTLRSAEVTAQDIQGNGTQDERIGMTGDLNRAQTQEKQATSDLVALRQLQAKGAASNAEVASAEQRLSTATSTLQSLQQRSTQRYSAAERTRSQAQVADARAALGAANSGLASANIRTPKSGTVYSIPVSEYDFVPAGEDMMDVADLNRIQIRAYFDEPEIGKLARGQAVKIVWDAKPNQIWHGHIERAPTTVITYGTRNVGECLITVDDARGDLLPNTNVTVTVTTSQRFNVLSIPREALHTEGASDFVYRVISGKLVRTPVQVGVVNLTRVEIISGLTEKDTVALSALNSRDLAPGLAVKVVE
jgi:HlyD family secretion protein